MANSCLIAILALYVLSGKVAGSGAVTELENGVKFNKTELFLHIIEEDRATLQRKQVELAMQSLWFQPDKGKENGIWMNVALHRPAEASSHSRNGLPTHVTDGDTRTYALTKYGYDQWIAISLDKSYHVGWVSLFHLKQVLRYARGFTVFTHNPSTGWHLCGLTRYKHFSTKPKYVIVDCPPDTYADHVLIILKGRGLLGFREIHVQAWV